MIDTFRGLFGLCCWASLAVYGIWSILVARRLKIGGSATRQKILLAHKVNPFALNLELNDVRRTWTEVRLVIHAPSQLVMVSVGRQTVRRQCIYFL